MNKSLCLLPPDGHGGTDHNGTDPNINVTEMEDMKRLTEVVPYVVPILFSFVILIGFFGNLLVVLVVILNKTMRNTTNILIFNLAVSHRFSKY